jgi:transposase InsO family protein
METLAKIKPMVMNKRMKMPRLGTRKLYYLLQDEIKQSGIKIGRDGLFSYLKWENMLIKPAKNYTITTNSKHWLRKYPNLYLDSQITRPEQVFVSDITYIKSNERTHYLSLVTDAFSRKIMGYELSDDMSSEHVIKALQMAVKNRTSSLPLIHHSDRGLQYCSTIYQQALDKANIIPSMTEGGNCYQNALAERMNGILKQEFLIHKCNTGKELKKLISESIKTYNNERPHLNLKMKTPNFIHEKRPKKINPSVS